MYAKLIDGNLVLAPNMLRTERGDVYNPSAALLEAAGWMPIIETPYPATEMDAIEDDTPQELPHYIETWQEQDGRIVQVWTECDPPEEPMHEPTLDERVTDVEGAVIELAEIISDMKAGE